MISYDVSFVKCVSGLIEDDNKINPYRYKTPVSPHLASNIESIYIDKQTIFDKYKDLAKVYDHIVVEGCGGLAVPLTEDGYMQYHLIKELGIGCILVDITQAKVL